MPAGRRVGERLERDQRAHERLAEAAGVARSPSPTRARTPRCPSSACSASICVGRRPVRRVPREHERARGRPAATSNSATVWKFRPTSSTGVARKSASGPATASRPSLAPPHPRDDRAVVEPDAQAHLHRDGSLDALDDAHDVRRLAARRHEVDQPDAAVVARELGLEDQRVVAVAAAGRRDLGRRAGATTGRSPRCREARRSTRPSRSAGGRASRCSRGARRARPSAGRR